ncbi:MAG: L-lactate dehydrogenase, partial [Mogibacterium sp.]|nr:L-lactate dehydrogenase [Mogibacterium sp.]
VAEWTGLPNGMVFGTGCILDTSRLVRSISDYIHINTEAIKCNIVGEHGDSQFAVWSRLTIAGMSMDDYCRNVGLEWGDWQKGLLNNKVRKMGATIIDAKGRTHYGIATCVCFLADAILNQRPSIAPVSSPLQGEYGIKGVSLSLPSIVGVRGIEHRLEETWSAEEVALLRKSAETLSSKLKTF